MPVPVKERRLDLGMEEETAGDEIAVDCAVDEAIAAPPRPFTMKLPSLVSEELDVLLFLEEFDRLAEMELSNPDPSLDPALLSRLYADAETMSVKSLMNDEIDNAMTVW